MNKRIIILLSLVIEVQVLLGCASGREFWNYIVEEPVTKTSKREVGEVNNTVATNHQQQVVKVAFNDGKTMTQVEIPVISSGQQIVIDHKGKGNDRNFNLIPLPPSDSDKAIEESYLKDGKSISAKAQPVSITKSQTEIQKLAKSGNYSLALEYVTQILERYPQHAESLRTKGALLLKMGEKKAALASYQKAQELEPSQRVQKVIDNLEKEEDKNP